MGALQGINQPNGPQISMRDRCGYSYEMKDVFNLPFVHSGHGTYPHVFVIDPECKRHIRWICEACHRRPDTFPSWAFREPHPMPVIFEVEKGQSN